MPTNLYAQNPDAPTSEMPVRAGHKIKTRLVDLDISLLCTDPLNPRIQNTIKWLCESGDEPDLSADHVSEEQLERIMVKYFDLDSLQRCIEAAGGASTRVIVKADGTVVEGNRRLLVHRRLVREGKSKFQRIQSQILPPGTTRADIEMELVKCHVGSTKPWPPIDKAEMLCGMREEGYTIPEIAIIAGLREEAVENFIKGFKLIREFQRVTGNLAPRYFTHCRKAAGQFKIFDGMADKAERKAKFFEWLNLDKFDDCRYVEDFSVLYDNPANRRKLDQEDMLASDVLEYHKPGHKPLTFDEIRNLPRRLPANLKPGRPKDEKMVKGLRSFAVAVLNLYGDPGTIRDLVNLLKEKEDA